MASAAWKRKHPRVQSGPHKGEFKKKGASPPSARAVAPAGGGRQDSWRGFAGGGPPPGPGDGQPLVHEARRELP